MSSAYQNSNLSTPQTQKPTRRQFLSALAIVGTLPLVPHIVGLEGITPQDFDTVAPPTFEPLTQDPIPQTAEALIKRLLDLSIIMAAEPARFGAWLKGDKLQDPVKVLRLFDEAEAAAEEYQRLMFSQEFDQLVLAPLCGGLECFTELMNTWPEAAESRAPETSEPVDGVRQAHLDSVIIHLELAAKR